MKKILLVFVTVWITVSGFAQKTADLGIWGGTSTYIGDINEVTPFQTFKPNFGAYFRYNFNARVGARFMFLSGRSSAEGVIGIENWEYSKGVQDISLQIEVNYLKYVLGLKNTPVTPYIMAGVGFTSFRYQVNEENAAALMVVNSFHPNVKVNESGVPFFYSKPEPVFRPTIPFGFGVKCNIGHRLGMGVEYQMRKLFTDKLDNLDDPLAYVQTKPDGELIETRYTDRWHNNDWSGYLGVHLTYMIYIGRKACPAYDSKYW